LGHFTGRATSGFLGMIGKPSEYKSLAIGCKPLRRLPTPAIVFIFQSINKTTVCSSKAILK
jgi:hypothetical protein